MERPQIYEREIPLWVWQCDCQLKNLVLLLSPSNPQLQLNLVTRKLLLRRTPIELILMYELVRYLMFLHLSILIKI